MRFHRTWRASGSVLACALAMPGLAGCGAGPADYRAPTLVFGEAGEHPGRLRMPRAIAFSPDGREIYVLDRTHRVQVFNANGHYLRGWPTPIPPGIPTTVSNPRHLCVGPDGRVWLADTHNGQLIVYESDGREVRRIGRPGVHPGEFAAVTGVALDPQGNVWTCEYGGGRDRVQKFDSSGKHLLSIGRGGASPGEFGRPQGLAVDSQGRVYVADAVNDRVQVFAPDGSLLCVWGQRGARRGELKYPYDVAVDRRGRVYVAEYGNCRISVFSAEGQFLTTWGQPGRGPGEFDQPWGVNIDPAGNVFVADTQNYRIQRFAGLPP